MQSDGASCRVVPVGGVYAFDNFQTTAEDLSATSYTYDAANQLTAMNVDGTTTNFTYDDWGRMAGKTQGAYAAAYTYRFGDKLKAVTSNFPGETASVAYNYDGLGRRRLEQLDNTTATWFRWSGWEECGEYAGTVGSWTIGALQTGYVPGLATFAGSNPAAAEWRYHLTDHLGSVRQLSSQNKAALARYDYAPYGELMRNAGLPLTIGYTGHLWDSAIGQYYAPFRYYNPQTARWNMRDPLGFVDGPNVYAYVAGNPVNYFDILGLTLFPDDNVVGGFCNGAIDGTLQLLDVANPLGKPFRNHGLYEPNSPGMRAGRISAQIGVNAAYFALPFVPFRPFTKPMQQVARWGGPIGNGSMVMTGGPTFRNALMAGRPLRYFKQPPTVAVLPRKALRWPKGVDFPKGLLGQRRVCLK